MADLRNVLVSGDFNGAKVVQIEKLQININKVESGGLVVNVGNLDSIDDYLSKIDALPPSMRKKATDQILKKLGKSISNE